MLMMDLDFISVLYKYKKYIFQPEFKNTEVQIGEKTGQDYNISIKPKTVKDFLK